MTCKNCKYYNDIANNSCKLGLFHFDTICDKYEPGANIPDRNSSQIIIKLNLQGHSLDKITKKGLL